MDKPDLNKPVYKLMPELASHIRQNRCPCCRNPIGEFRDKASEHEYSVSGMCQNCQDAIYG